MNNFLKKKNELKERAYNLVKFSLGLDEEEIKAATDSLKNELEGELTFNVLCLGDFSSGKTTFVNNFFIKKPILPTAVTETTAKLSIIKYGEKERVRIVYKDKTDKEFTDKLEDVLKKHIAKDGEEVDNVDFIEVFINSEILKEGVVIVDAPGLNAPENDRMKLTFDFLKKADSVLYLLTAMQAWKKSEKEFLEDKVLRKEDLDKIFFLINYWDMVEENQRESVIKFVKNQMKISLKITSAEMGIERSELPLIPISAKTSENFEKLEKDLWEYLSKIKGNEILKNKLKKFDSLKLRIKEYLEEKMKLQEKEFEQVSTELENLKRELDEHKGKVELFNERVKNKVLNIKEKWLDEIKEFYENLNKEIIERIYKRFSTVTDEEQLKQLINKTVSTVFYVKDGELDIIINKFLKELREIVKDERGKLNITPYLVKNDILNFENIKEALKNDISPEFNDLSKIANVKSVFTTSASLAIGLTIAPILGLIAGLGGLLASVFDDKKKEEIELLKQREIIEEKSDDFIKMYLNKLKGNEDGIVEKIVGNIESDIVNIYNEKLKIYEDTIKNKEENKENEMVLMLKDKIKELEEL